MKNENLQNDSLFEMILENPDENYAAVEATPSAMAIPEDWHIDHQEGQLAVDVFELDNEIAIVSTMAGAKTDKIEVYVHNDLLTIRGERVCPVAEEKIKQYFHGECFWGKFSRTIVLPVHVEGHKAKAEYKNGILTVKVPKAIQGGTIPIKIVEE